MFNPPFRFTPHGMMHADKIKSFFVVVDAATGKMFINTPSFYPSHNIELPYRDPFTTNVEKVKFHNSMKMAEQTAVRLSESYDDTIDMMKDQYDDNLEKIRSNPSRDWRTSVGDGSIAEYVQYLKDRNIFYHDKIAKMEKSRPKVIEATQITALCMIC